MTNRGSRVGVIVAIVALTLPIIALGVVFTGIVTSPAATTAAADAFSSDSSGEQAAAQPEEVSDNPLAGVSFYVDPTSLAATAAAESAAADAGSTAGATSTASPSSTTAKLEKLAAQPTAIWLTPEKYPTASIAATVTSILDDAQSKGSMPVFVVYGVPNRDCGNFSVGGLTAADYPLWVAQIASAVTARQAVVILEPDALALSGQCGNADERIAEVKGAVDTFASTKAVVYLDGGHSTWLPANQMADLLNRAGIAEARGFVSNVSNYNSTVKERAYGEKLSKLTGNSHYVIDTGRNGKGSTGEWCNPSGRALGATSSAITNAGHLDAQLWVKPPGESDGTCNGGPAAGVWWPQSALELATNAGW